MNFFYFHKDEQFSDIKDTPLEEMRNKIIKEREQHIKQRILAEKDQIYDEGDDNDSNQDDGDDDAEYDDGKEITKKKTKK